MTGFFILSGFSNHYVYLKRDMNKDIILLFYFKRLISIMPTYYFAALIYIFFCGKETLIENVFLAPIEILGIQRMFPNTFELTHNGGTWFISCILICYFVFPYLNGIIKWLNKKVRIGILIGLYVLLLYLPLAVNVLELGSIYDDPFVRCFEFMIGMLLASFYDDFKKINILTRKRVILLETILLVTGVEIAWRLGIARGNYMLYSWIGLPAFIFMVLSFSSINLSNHKLISYLSEVSYCFFLVQLFIWKIMEWISNLLYIESNFVKIVISFGVCLLLSVLMHELIEKPSKNWEN